MNTSNIPEPPKEQVTLKEEDQERLRIWIEFFKKLSSRIHLVTPADETFRPFYESVIPTLKNNWKVHEDYTFKDWPKMSKIVFVVAINSSLSGSIVATREIQDCFIFCLDNRAFGLDYFSWDGGEDNSYSSTTYSLEDYSEEALSWNHIKDLIVEKVRRFNNRIPILQES